MVPLRIGIYTIIETIAETARSLVYRARRDGDADTVIIKQLRTDRATSTDIARFRQEYALISSIDDPGVVRTREIVTDGGTVAIVMEDAPGAPLKEMIADGPMELRRFLGIAAGTADALDHIHRNKIIHGDVKPSNILIDRDSYAAKITDFGIARTLTREGEDLYQAGVIEGTLAYLSPEQTGRMNRAVDHRSDLYSLGVTFYEMLTGAVPFRSRDPLEVIHAHIAKKPVPPLEIQPSVPPVVSAIVMKLLAKAAEDRYQTAAALAADLRECIARLDATGRIDDFAIAANDVSANLRLSHVFVGREGEIGELNAAFARVTAKRPAGDTAHGGDGAGIELVLVAGPPGIGKTALVNELQRPVLVERGYFVSGKFEQYTRDIPYSAIVQALRALAARILTENPERVAAWRERLKAGFGNIGRVITDIVPEFELITGKQPDVPELGPQESQNRFNYAFRNFVTALTSGNPLVIFLDDLQWADMASLNVLRAVASDQDTRNLLIIGAYRDTEVSESHPAMMAVDDMAKSIRVTTMELPPLKPDRVNEILSILLRSDRTIAAPLAELVYAKTGGNPFFVYQFLGLLRDRELLTIAAASQASAADGVMRWTWDMEAIRSLPVTENVVDLMAGKISLLPGETQDALRIAACIGTIFDPSLLAKVMDTSLDEILRLIAPAIAEGYLAAEGASYLFTHDKIQEAAYAGLTADVRNAHHYRVGSILLETAPGHMLDEKIIVIVDQLNHGILLLGLDEHRVRLAELNLRAAMKSWRSAAFLSAYRYCLEGIGLLPGDSWDARYTLALALHSLGAQAAYLSGDAVGMERLADVVITRARSTVDCADVHAAKINSCKSGDPERAIDIYLSVSAKLSLPMPAHPTKLHIAWEFLKSKMILRGRTIDDMLSQEYYVVENFKASSRLNVSTVDALLFARPLLYALSILKNLNYQFSNNIFFDDTLLGYIAYGIMLCSITTDFDKGYRWGTEALEYMHKKNIWQFRAQSIMIMNSFIVHWKDHWNTTLQPLIEAYEIGLETGEFRFASHSLIQYSQIALFTGKPLESVANDLVRFHRAIITMQNVDLEYQSNMLAQVTRNLMGHATDPCALCGDSFDEEKFIPILRAMKQRTILFYLYTFKMMICFLFENFDTAFACLQEASHDLDAVMGLPCIPEYYFYDAIVSLALVSESSRGGGPTYWKRIKVARKKMKTWAFHAPMNHGHKLDLIDAEISRVKGKYLRAERFYDRAIAGARENEYLNEEALACERAACFYRERGMEYVAGKYMTMAHERYTKWGALAKVEQLEEKYPEYFRAAPAPLVHRPGPDDSSTTSSGLAASLDIGTVLKATRAISGEIELARLLETLLTIAMENAGAERGALIREKDGELVVEAEGSIDGDIQVAAGPLTESYPRSIVTYVHRTGETVLLDDAANRGLFTGDQYITMRGSKSILCAPVLDRGKAAGILYLENNLAAGAFTPERLELLNILSAQAAISLENARLVVMEKEKAALDREIEMAEKIQRSLLPREIPDLAGARVAYRYVPMAGVGGDFVAIRVPAAPDRRLGLFICDVSGHGVPAAMTASMVSAALAFFWDRHPADQGRIFPEMQAFLKGRMGGNFFTAILATLDTATGELVLVNAGHPRPIIIRKNGTIEMARCQGRIIHEFFEPRPGIVSVSLSPGDRLVLYTDGITEAMNARREMLGIEDGAFLVWIAGLSATASSPDDFCERIRRGVADFSGSEAMSDDVTVLVCEYTG